MADKKSKSKSKRKTSNMEGGTAPRRLGRSKSQIGEMLSNAYLREDMKDPKKALTKMADDEFGAGLDDAIRNPEDLEDRKYKGLYARGKQVYAKGGLVSRGGRQAIQGTKFRGIR
jgi:hypothetical protein